eukprot:m.179025 g.179025  ORF g.179025 m.179025 type:complete len:176 (+) comp39203_c0_seq2:421-948(+)
MFHKSGVCRVLLKVRGASLFFHPLPSAGNGGVERSNRSIGDMLAKVVSEDQKDWVDHLPMAQLALNAAIHDSVEESPFKIIFKKPPRVMIDVMADQVMPSEGGERMGDDDVEKMYERVKAASEKSAEVRQRQFNKKRLVVNWREGVAQEDGSEERTCQIAGNAVGGPLRRGAPSI